LPYLDRVKDGPIAYLCQSVRNFFSDWILQQVNQLSAVGDLADLEKLELMRLRKRMGRKPNLTPKY